MNAVLMYNFIPPMVNGAIINSFEYFLCAYEHNKNVFLYFINTNINTKEMFVEMIRERYNLDGIEDFHKNILICNRNDLLYMKFKTVLVHDYSTIKMTRGLINADEILVISDNHTTNFDYMYSKKTNNVTYFAEMPFQYKDINYKMKMLFSRYKPIDTCDKATYIHSPKNTDRSFVDQLNLPDQPIIFRETGHMKGLFTKFDTFVYYHAHTWFDLSPRLMHECYFYNKKIIYINDFELKDGSWYRYEDLKRNGIKGRYLTPSDPIIGKMI